MRFPFFYKLLPFLIFFVVLACNKRNYNVDMLPKPVAKVNALPDSLLAKGISPDSLIRSTPKDSLNQPSLKNAISDTIKTPVKEEKKPKKKKKKNVFLGYRIKKGITRSGKGKSAVIERFSYLKTYQEPNPYAPAKYYYHVKKRKIFKGRTIDPKVAKILHGPYKKLQNGITLEEGYFYIGTKHLRWEKYNKNGILLGKSHFEKGFPRDAQITYYDAARQHIKEVIPYMNGEVEGDYVKFRNDGLMEWEGQYENGRKVGVWIEYWPFRNRKHYEYQYAETGYDAPIEPYLIRQYNKNNVLIYEKGKIDKRAEEK